MATDDASTRRASYKKSIIKAGDGVNFPKRGDTVTMHYEGFIYDSETETTGKKFDSSIDRGSPFVTKIGVQKVILGWDDGVPTMSKGEKATLVIPPEAAYGERGFPNMIPSNSTLKFNVELLNIKRCEIEIPE